MYNKKVPASTVVAVWALIVISILAISVARADDVGLTDQSHPLGFDYCPLRASEPAPEGLPGAAGRHLPELRLIELSPPTEPPAGISARETGVDMKNAFRTLQHIKRNEKQPAQGQANLLSLFESGESALSRQVGTDFLADPIENDSREIPETLAMLLLGTGLIGLARIQRRHTKD